MNLYMQISSRPHSFTWRDCFPPFLQACHLQEKIPLKTQNPCAQPLANWCGATCIDQFSLLMIDRLLAHCHQDFIWVYFLHCILFYYFILCWFSSGAPPKISSPVVVNNAVKLTPRTKGKGFSFIFVQGLDCDGMSKKMLRIIKLMWKHSQ